MAACLAALGLAGFSQPALAWKPVTHVYLAEQGLQEAINEGRVKIFEVDAAGKVVGELGEFEVDPSLRAALRAAPGQFRAGVVGPDAFPDMLTGQQIIHPDVAKALPGGVSGSDAWLTHIWSASAGRGPEARAFAAGFLTHAAGDVFGHTFVNAYTGGPFTITPLSNASKHMALEAYIGERTPDAGRQLALNIGGLEGFIRDEMVLAEPGTPLQTHLLVDRQLMSMPLLFSGLRQELQNLIDKERASRGPDLLNAAVALYAQAWIRDIDIGLAALPALSAQVARAIIYPARGLDITAAATAFSTYARNHLWSMIGAPDGAVSLAYIPSDLAEAVLPEEVMEYARLLATETFELTMQQAFGMSVDGWVDQARGSSASFERNFGAARLATFNREQLGLASSAADLRWKINEFAPAFNTVQLSKMILLSDAGWRDLARVMAAKGAPIQVPPRGNVMLGWVHSLDEGNAWRGLPGQQGGPSAVPVFAANGAIYSKLFMPQVGAAVIN